jgi:hypothetical protein
MTRAVWLAISLAISSLLGIFAPGQASASFCSATVCSLMLTDSSFTGTGMFGTVTLSLLSNVATINVNLTNMYRIVVTGFPGAIGFADNLGGGLTIGNVESGGIPTSLYQGSQSLPSGCTTNDCHWGNFGYANDAAATSGPQRPASLEELSFTVSKGTSITDVRQLLQQFIPSGGNAPAYFTVDACLWDLKKSTCGGTGLFAVTRIPEPGSLVVLASGLLALGFLRWKRVI